MKLEDFCDMYLANMSDDKTIKYRLHRNKITLIKDSIYRKNVPMSVSSNRFNSIEIYREKVITINRFNDRYNEVRSLDFKWSEIYDDVTQFIHMCEYQYGLTTRQPSIIFDNRYKGIATLSIDDLDILDDNSTFFRIFINIINKK